MALREEDVRNRSASSPSMPPAWVFSASTPNGHQYEDGYPGSPSSDQPFVSPALLESIRPKSVPPEGEVHSTPPKPPPLPTPSSIKERRKFSRKYGSGVYAETSRDATPAGSSLESRTGYISGNPTSIFDGYGVRPLGFGPTAAPTSTDSGYGSAAQLPPIGSIPGDPYSAVPSSYGAASSLTTSTQSAVERQEHAAKERARKEERAKLIGKMIHGLDSTQINEVLSMIMTPDQVESLRFYSETAAKMRNKVEKKDWNKEFQKLLARPDDQLKFRKLYNLAHDFVYAASTYAKIIISELLLPESEKTIKPAALGGLAGGTKYVVQNIMFKFVLDFELKPGLWMYGSGDQRSDENAMKSASHELKGLMSYYSCNIRGLCFPLQALVDYKGFRVLAISILPINDETIIYGSSDAGKTVHSRLPEFNEKIDTAARILNLKPHYVNPTVQLSGPGDLEGHLGTDGKFYVLDAARTLPPEGPDENPEFREDRQVYYKLLRPEFVRKWNQPLCSDAFTSWQRYDPNRTENNLEVLKATRYLHEKLIPKFAERLDKMASSGTTFADESKHDGTVSESFRLNRELFAKKWAIIQDRRQTENANDINTQQISTSFVGAINPMSASALRKSGSSGGKSPVFGGSTASRRPRGISMTLHSSLGSTLPGPAIPQTGDQSKDAETSSKELDIILMNEEMHRIGLNLRHLGEVRAHVKSDAPRQRILIEMVARVIKDLLRAHLRHKMREVRVLSEEPFKEVVIKVFNFVLGRSPASSNFWTLVKSRLQRKYKASLAKAEKEEPDPMTLCSKMDMAVLFRRLEHLLGITLTESAREELESYPDSFEFVDSDVAEIYPKVKHMQIVDHAEGMALFLTAQRLNVGRRERLRQLRLSCEKFARALTTLPDSFTTLYQWGLALIEEAQMTAAFGAVRLYLRAADKFRSAVTINPQFQACFIKLGEAYIELARAAISATQNGQSLALPEIDDWEDSFREELATEHKTPPKSAPKRYFIKATQAWDRGLALPDFFFEEVYQDILRLHSDAVFARDTNRVKSRQLFYGSAILCEVVHNALNDHRLLLNGNAALFPAAPSSTASSAVANIATNLFSSKSECLPSTVRSELHPTVAGHVSSSSAPVHTTLASSPGNASNIGSSSSPNIWGPASLNGPSTSLSGPVLSPSMPNFVFSSGISVAVPANTHGATGGSSSTPRIKDVISVITPALKTRLQSTPSQILTSPYATGIGDEFAAMKTTSSNLNLASSNPQASIIAMPPISTSPPQASHAIPIPGTSVASGSSGTSTPISGSLPNSPSGSLQSITSVPTVPPIPAIASIKSALASAHTISGSSSHPGTPQSASSNPPRAPVSVGYITAGFAVVKQTDSPVSSPAQSPKTSGIFSHPSTHVHSASAPAANPEHITIPVSTWTPQDWSGNPNVRPMHLPPLSLPLLSHPESDSDSDRSTAIEASSEGSSTSGSDHIGANRAKNGLSIPLLPMPSNASPPAGLVSSKSAGNLYHQGIVPHDANESSLEQQEPETPRKFKVALEAAPPTPYQRPGMTKLHLPLDLSNERSPSLVSSTELQNSLSPSTSLLTSSSVSGPGASLKSVGIGLKNNKQTQEPSQGPVMHPKPRRMRHSASVSAATSPAIPKPAPFVQLLPSKPSPSPQPSGVSTTGQYYSGVAEDEIQQLLNLSQKTGSQSSIASAASGAQAKGDSSTGDTPSVAIISEAKFKPFLVRSNSPPLSASKRAEKGDEDLYLKRILLDILAIWSDSLIQYASLKQAGDEMLFLAGAVKLRDVLALDNSYLEIIQTKIIPELKYQARDNRRIHYVLAALHGVIHEHDPTNTQLIYDMGDSLHTYAQLHRLNPAKLELHQGEAAECFEEALSLDPSFADEMIHKALMVQGSTLESLLSIVEYSKAMHERTRYLWDERVSSVTLAGCASVHDLTLSKLASLCPQIKKIDVSRCSKISDQGLASISKVVLELTHLNLSECPGITDAGLQTFFVGQQEVGGPKLEYLNLKGCLALTDAAVTQISLHCPSLTHLDLEHCKITNNAAATLAQYPLPRLTYLSFALCVKLEDTGIAEMVKIRRFSLTTIKLNGCNMLSDVGLETLVAGMPSLTELHLASIYRISNVSVSQALAKLPNLSVLDIRNCKGLTWEVFINLPFDSSLKMLFAARMDPSGRPEDAETHAQRRISKIRGMKALCAHAAPGLQVLDIGESNMPEEPLYQLGLAITHRLVKLDLSGCPLVTDELISVYAPRVPHMTHLNLNGCYQLTSRGISLLAQHCKSMRELFLSKIYENRESSLLELVDSMPQLLKLDLSGNMHVTDVVLADIAAKLPQLDHLNVTQCTKISDKGLRLITENLTRLVHLSMGGCLGITNESLACVAKHCRSLKELNISRCSITDQGLNSLAEGVTALRSVDLDNLSLITDAALSHLVKHQDSLVDVSIKFCTKITAECKVAIFKQYPALKLRVDPSGNSAFVKELAEASKGAHSLRTISSANIESAIRKQQAAAPSTPPLSEELQSKFDRIKRPKSESVPPEPPKASVHIPYDDPAIVRYSLAQLTSKDPVTANCNPECLELYLDDEEFRQSFGMTKTEFASLIPWRKRQSKEALRLF